MLEGVSTVPDPKSGAVEGGLVELETADGAVGGVDAEFVGGDEGYGAVVPSSVLVAGAFSG